MIKETFNRRIFVIIVVFVLLVVLGVILSLIDSTNNRIYYSTFKDLIPLVLGIAASYITYLVQQRLSFLKQLNIIWSETVSVIQHAAHFCEKNEKDEETYYQYLINISIVIDDIRGLYKNLEEDYDGVGLYPFEPIKEVYVLFKKYGMSDNKDSNNCKNMIYKLWKSMRKEFLKEFNRQIPSFTHSHWINNEQLTFSETNLKHG